MAWRENEARERLIQATLTFKDLHGPEKLIDWLEHELHRELVVRLHAEGARGLIAAESAAQQSADQRDIAVKALEFYANGDNHRARSGQQSAVAKDKGRRARNALEAISGEGEAEAGEGEGDD